MNSKSCLWCGRDFERRPKDALQRFEARLYCSRRCAGLSNSQARRVEDPAIKSRYRRVTTPDGRDMLEHRWVMEQRLGRRLEDWEQVHHKNHNRLDNRPANLEVVSSREHGQRHTWRPTSKACAVCGAQFTPHKTKRARQQTCSPECRKALISRLAHERVGGPYFVTCERCGKAKAISSHRVGKAKFCSVGCANARSA